MSSYKYYELPVCYLASGLELKLPVHEFDGGNGPIIGLTACIHGDETIGCEILRRVTEELKNSKVLGTIKIMPVASPLGFEQGKRSTPLDHVNMNRIFPGNPNSTPTEIQASVISEKFLTGLDAYIDVHSGGQEAVVDYAYISNDEEFSRSFLSNILYKPEADYVGTSGTFTTPKGISTVVIECGGGSNGESYITKAVKGIMNMLKFKKAIEGEAIKRDDQIVVTHIEHVNPHHGGLFVPALEYSCMNQIVEGKVVLGRVYNPMTFELLEEIMAPYEKNLIILMRGSVNCILAGDFSFMIGDLNTQIK